MPVRQQLDKGATIRVSCAPRPAAAGTEGVVFVEVADEEIRLLWG